MVRNDSRRDPLSGAPLPFARGTEVEREPVAALGMVPGNEEDGGGAAVKVLERRPSTRETRIRPSEKRRRGRRLAITFTRANTPDRIRDLAVKWNLFAPDGQSPNVSAVVEYLLMPQLIDAERGKIAPPRGGQQGDSWV